MFTYDGWMLDVRQEGLWLKEHIEKSIAIALLQEL